MAIGIIFYSQEEDAFIEGELCGNEGDFIFVDHPTSGPSCEKRYKVHCHSVIAQDGHIPSGKLKRETGNPNHAFNGYAIAIFSEIVKICNEGKQVSCLKDWGGNTLTILIGDVHSHVGVPSGDEETLLRHLRNLLCEGQGLAWV